MRRAWHEVQTPPPRPRPMGRPSHLPSPRNRPVLSEIKYRGSRQSSQEVCPWNRAGAGAGAGQLGLAGGRAGADFRADRSRAAGAGARRLGARPSGLGRGQGGVVGEVVGGIRRIREVGARRGAGALSVEAKKCAGVRGGRSSERPTPPASPPSDPPEVRAASGRRRRAGRPPA
jgi:hypothetical protein